LLENALVVPKERKETKIPRAVKEKRLNAKKVMISIEEDFNIKITDEEFRFYFNNIKINHITQLFLHAFYSRFFKKVASWLKPDGVSIQLIEINNNNSEVSLKYVSDYINKSMGFQVCMCVKSWFSHTFQLCCHELGI
jgi:cyclopropane fatty-acyl-phospholipid synthase-like methyltransferase